MFKVTSINVMNSAISCLIVEIILQNYLMIYCNLWNKIHHFKGRSRRLRPKAHILDGPLANPYDVLKVLLGPPYGPLQRSLMALSDSRRSLLRNPEEVYFGLQESDCISKRTFKRHKGSPRGHLRCELWVLIDDSSL